MFNLSFFELTIFGIIALIILGPDRLIQTARGAGRWYAFLKKAKNRLQNDMLHELNLLETQEQIKVEIAKLRDTESQIKAQMTELQNRINQNKTDILNLEKDTALDELAKDTPTNRPLTDRFFLLSEYDRKRRLPPPPFLAKTVADKLLF